MDEGDRIVAPGTVLQAILRRQPDGSARSVPEPLTPLLDTTLLTNAPGEPNLWSQLLRESQSADAIDVLMAFIRKSGIAPLIETFRRHCAEGRSLRILTTTYTGSTEQSALDLLSELGAQIRISYDLTSTRLHAKAWLFHRSTGFSTAFIGSSNLTYSAQVTGLEWNVRASSARNPDVLSKFAAVFESYWQSDDFVAYDSEVFRTETARVHRTDHGPLVILPGIELRPEPFQERLLEIAHPLTPEWPPPKSIGLGYGYGQDSHGSRRLCPPSRNASSLSSLVRGTSGGDSRSKSWDISLRSS